jgi:hypothetical protein
MRSPFGRRVSDRPPARPWLADWLETGPVPADGLRRVLVVGDLADAELLAARLPDAHVVIADRHASVGDGFDLVAVVGIGADAAEVLATAAAAVRDGGALLVLTRGGTHSVGGPLPAGWDAAAAGLRLVAFDDLTDGAGSTVGRPRRWLRATYRRVSR